MQVQIHQRVKILKKDLLWVLSVEGRGGDRMIKAFGHNLNITDACSQSQPQVLRFPYTHLPMDRGFTNQFIITVWAPSPPH